MNQGLVDVKELERFLDYLQDKVEDVYQNETKQAIKRFMKEDVDRLNGANITRG
ncbi:hypothetical protein J2R98_002941 [Alkalibacillus filiformis]|uniref:Uncharacterized protein n=1 Tax=Alkalibacillus filiformis TaxID=200990 RepID=A0ABU0DY86_9BACI|nr:hypothetical protein [Alkalibacillus filiformis]MDQ0353080.1 hypothetical protein [Alkalibacillus filiformis]